MVEEAPGSGTGAEHGRGGPRVRNWSWARWRRPRGQELELGTVNDPGSGAGAGHGGEGPGVRSWSWRWECSHRGFVGQSKARD